MTDSDNTARPNSTDSPDTADQPDVLEQRDNTEMLGARDDSSNPASKDPSDWVTGDEPMTAAQRSYLDTLAREAGEEIPADITKAEASEQIERLQRVTGRGASTN